MKAETIVEKPEVETKIKVPEVFNKPNTNISPRQSVE